MPNAVKLAENTPVQCNAVRVRRRPVVYIASHESKKNPIPIGYNHERLIVSPNNVMLWIRKKKEA